MNILFVDDEQDILDGLRNVLRGERARWSMRFALGGEAALREMEAKPFDVVVTDMRMPGMDGVALLGVVREKHPQAARIVLSGHADLAAVARASTVAHQYVLKPCEPGTLRTVIERALRLQGLLANDDLRKLVGGLGTLPTAPRVYQALTAALGDPDVEIKELAEIVKQDVGLATRVLQFVNSAYCGLAQRTSSLESAIMCLGLNTLRHLALTVEMFRGFGSSGGKEFEKAERHAVLTARIARRITPEPATKDVAFAAALLHDAGKLVLMSRSPEAYQRAAAEARRSGVPQHVCEQAALGATHAEVGAYLLGLWDLPHNIVEPAAFHHALDRVVGRQGLDTIAVVALADALAHEVAKDEGEGTAAALLEALASLGDLSRWRDLALAEASAVG